MNTSRLIPALLALAFAFSPTSRMHALPVDLSTPPSVLGPTSDQGYATHWIELAELDFGGGLTLPVRLGFLSGRSTISTNFGAMPWRTPLLNSRIYDRTAASWKVLLPCGRIMTLVPDVEKPGRWATADGEWFVTPKDKHTLVSRLDGWEMEFDAKDYLVRLRTDGGRQVVWNRDAGGSVLTVVEQPQDAKKPATLGFTVRRDATTKLVSSFTYRTAAGQKVFTLGYDAERRLSAVTFPDQSAHQMTYSTTTEGHPTMAVTGRGMPPASLTWHKENRTLLSDGTWTYSITPQPDNNPVMTRTGPYGEIEIQHDDRVNAREIFTAADGTQTVRHKVKSGAAKGKLQTITRILSEAAEPKAANREQKLYSAVYDARGLLTEETDALGRKTTHTYTLHGTTVHTGLKTHVNTLSVDGLSVKTSAEFDTRGNLVTATNALGHTFRYEYDSQNRRVKTTGPDGTVVESLTYTTQGHIASRTDAVGATTRYGYDKDGHRTSATDALGHTTTDEFNALGLRIKSTDPLGRVTVYDYDKGGRLIQQTVAHGTPIAATTQYTYDAQGRRLTTTDPAGHTTAQTYDKLGRLTSRTDALGHTTRYEYDVKRGSTGCISCSATDLPTRIISPSGRITERRYHADRHLIEETVAAGRPEAATTRQSYDLAGNLVSSTDPLGRTTTYGYDALNHKVKTTYPDGSSRAYVCNALGQRTAETDELGHTTKREYDVYGNLVALTTPEGHTTQTLFGEAKAGNGGMAALHRPTTIVTAGGLKTAITYDLAGHRATLVKGAGSPLAATTSYTYDASGNEIAETTAAGRLTTHEYDARNRLIRTRDALNRTWTFAYDLEAGSTGCCGADEKASPHAATTTHPDGTQETRLLNAAGQLISTTDARGSTIRYSYDADGRVTGQTDARGKVTHWRYDARGKLAAKVSPDGTTEFYEHDLAGQIVRRVRPDGAAAIYTYNVRGRLVSVRWSDDGRTEPATFAYDAAGHLTLAQNRSATIRRSYTPDGRMARETQEVHPDFVPSDMAKLKAEIAYAYTPEGQLARITYPDHTTVAYEYNARAELARVIDSGLKSGPAIFEYGRRLDGRIEHVALPNGTRTTKLYDEAGRLQTIAHLDRTGKVLESESSRYDLGDRRISRSRADGSTDLFRYDPAGQVTAAAYGQAAASVLPADTSKSKPETLNFEPSQTFQYDAAGNRMEVTDNGMTTKYQPNDVNQYTRIETSRTGESVVVESQFDPLGNLLQDDRNTYTWDSDIHLLSVTTKDASEQGQKAPAASTVSYRYDPLHRRVARLEGSHQLTTFTYDGWNVIAEHQAGVKTPDPALKLTARHTWGVDLSGTSQGAGGIGGLLASVHSHATPGGGGERVACCFHYDSLGNVILLTDLQGQTTARYAYNAFGQTRKAEGICAQMNRYRFSTKPVEQGSGLAYYGYRYYDTVTGRWPNNDPIGHRGGMNLLAFSNNNPNQYVDKLGNHPQDYTTGDPVDPSTNTNQNCMGYALGENQWVPSNPIRLPSGEILDPLANYRRDPVAVATSHDGTTTTCDNEPACPCGEHRIVIFEEVGNSTNWHVYRDDGDETYSCKYGEGGIYDNITNPMEDYVETYQPSGEVRQTCMCVPNLDP